MLRVRGHFMQFRQAQKLGQAATTATPVCIPMGLTSPLLPAQSKRNARLGKATASERSHHRLARIDRSCSIPFPNGAGNGTSSQTQAIETEPPPPGRSPMGAGTWEQITLSPVTFRLKTTSPGAEGGALVVFSVSEPCPRVHSPPGPDLCFLASEGDI